MNHHSPLCNTHGRFYSFAHHCKRTPKFRMSRETTLIPKHRQRCIKNPPRHPQLHSLCLQHLPFMHLLFRKKKERFLIAITWYIRKVSFLLMVTKNEIYSIWLHCCSVIEDTFVIALSTQTICYIELINLSKGNNF